MKLENIPLFCNLPDDETERLKYILHPKTFAKGETLFMEGLCCERIFVVREGRVKIYRTSSSGRQQILEILNPGDTCACNPGSQNWNCSSSAEALTDCAVWFLSRDDYIRLIQSSSKAAQALNRLFADRLKNMSALVEQISLMDAKKRLVKFLLDLESDGVAKGQKGCVISLPFTREEIAERLGTARETVARQLYALQRKRLISLKPKSVLILNKEGLEKLLE